MASLRSAEEVGCWFEIDAAFRLMPIKESRWSTASRRQTHMRVKPPRDMSAGPIGQRRAAGKNGEGDAYLSVRVALEVCLNPLTGVMNDREPGS
jgi:hypothetical protein